jgi:hypothetical protein
VPGVGWVPWSQDDPDAVPDINWLHKEARCGQVQIVPPVHLAQHDVTHLQAGLVHLPFPGEGPALLSARANRIKRFMVYCERVRIGGNQRGKKIDRYTDDS